MKKEYSDVANKTKKIYISQHKNYSIDDQLFQRFLRVALDTSSYLLPQDYFEGKSVLDAGCGNTGYFQVAMHKLGAKKITCLDLGTEWMPELKSILSKYEVPQEKIECVDGSTTELPFENDVFDFVASNGVIMHLESVDQAKLALKELARVTRPGGFLYVYVGIDQPGIVDEYIVPALRQAYKENNEFRSYIDQLSPQKVHHEIEECYSAASSYDPLFTQELIKSVSSLFTLDTSTFFQNLLQVPIQQGPKLSYEWASSALKAAGFNQITRIPERYWQRSDFRRFLAPLHYRRDVPLAKILYGGGHIKLVAKK